MYNYAEAWTECAEAYEYMIWCCMCKWTIIWNSYATKLWDMSYVDMISMLNGMVVEATWPYEYLIMTVYDKLCGLRYILS